MKKTINHTGETYNSWTIISETKNKKVVAKCTCGIVKEVILQNILRGISTNCGCTRYENSRRINTKHGYRKTKLYHKWCNMKNRCNNSNVDSYKDYGGRGITVCDEWVKDFIKFKEWALNNGYDDSLEIDRINTNGNYEPNNCRFVTKKQNANNKRNNITLTINGVTKAINDWALENGIPRNTIIKRIKLGWKGEKILIKGVKGRNQHSIQEKDQVII